MNNIKTLLFLDLWKIKNMIIQILKNPVLFLKKLFSIVLFFGICFSTIIVSIFKNDSKLSINLEIQQSILGIISLVSFLIILFVISHYLNDYAPSNFSVPDINYLFPSPIDNKIILFYSMIKSGLKGVLNFFMIILYALLFILTFTNLSLIGLIPIAIGFFFIFLFFITLSYLFFAIKVTFNFTKKLKILSYITQGIAIIIVSFYFY
ncbi:putative ABC exporter domain-containing protein, partial [Clostridium sp. AL.422]|uniref:putative ABC exporter domain-containing protein n=1 Tax=Clostridium TaxID=1485 RepID=UPI00293DBF27